MVELITLLWRLFTYDVQQANEWAARYVNMPSLVLHLDAISWRESNHQALGPHKIDSAWESTVRQKALDRGLLNRLCPFHWFNRGMSTNGPHGMMYAYNVRHFMSCIPTKLFAMPLVSAYVAVRRYQRRCMPNLWKRKWGPFPHDGWCPTSFLYPRKSYGTIRVTVNGEERKDEMILVYQLPSQTHLYYKSVHTGSIFVVTPGHKAKFLCKGDEWGAMLKQLQKKVTANGDEQTEIPTGIE